MIIYGWGRYPVMDAEIVAPLSVAEARTAVTDVLPAIVRGCGRSYGDSSLASRVISTSQLNHLLAFDDSCGLLSCAAGVSLADLLHVFVPRGWFPPVTPGTKFVTVGGAIASDVHGKNHHGGGCFSEFVDSFDLLLADGTIVRCSRSEYGDLFRATCGGMGLTGTIVEAKLRLRRIQSSFVEQTTYKAKNLNEALDLFDAHQDATYSVAWIDCLATGASLGRSLVMTGEHSDEGTLQCPTGQRLSVPIDMPPQVLNRSSMRLFNAFYYQRIRSRESHQRVRYDTFFYPLDHIQNWNRIYGKGGFVQYQFVIPRAAGSSALTQLCKVIADSRRGSFLAVLKSFGPENDNFLSFPLEGYTLSVDFKMDASMLKMLDELDAMVVDFGGRIYLTKDARMKAPIFKRSYPRWEQFQEIRERYFARGRFVSEQSLRLGLDS